MASKYNKSRSKGAGRTANSEPRLQVFKEFAGCNFQHHEDVDLSFIDDDSPGQSDLAQNFVTIQNNVTLTSNKTLETRHNIQTLCHTDDTRIYISTVKVIGSKLFMGVYDGRAEYGRYKLLWDHLHKLKGGQFPENEIKFSTGTVGSGHVTEIHYIDNTLVVLREENGIWFGDWSSLDDDPPSLLSKPDKITFVTNLEWNDLQPQGTLEISKTFDADKYPYRTDVSYCYVNKFGPTQVTSQGDGLPDLTFYSNKPVSEWHSDCYLRIVHKWPTYVDPQFLSAAEIFYAADNASSMILAGRVDYNSGDSTWTFDWHGYIDSTDMYAVANLVVPTQNYTEGVPVCHMKYIDGRCYFWGDPNHRDRLYIGGNPGNLFSIASGTSGGFVDIEPGSSKRVQFVDKYKTQSGSDIVTILCDSPNTTETKRYNLVENTITLSNEQNTKSWQSEQVSGSIGTHSSDGAVVCADGLYALSRYGVGLTTLTMEYNSQVKTTYISDNVKPWFTENPYISTGLSYGSIIEIDNILYIFTGATVEIEETTTSPDGASIMSTSAKSEDQSFGILCYDIDRKAWWTMTIDGVSKKQHEYDNIIQLFHIDCEGTGSFASMPFEDALGIASRYGIYYLPTRSFSELPDITAGGRIHSSLIETGELSTKQPLQQWSHVSQIEFHFDHFYGSIEVELVGIDQFGRKVSTKKIITHKVRQYNLTEYMRIDLKLCSYKLRIKDNTWEDKDGNTVGGAYYRLTHWISKLYTMSNKQGLVWGFDSNQAFRSSGDIHPTFNSYNDIIKAIVP